MGNMHTPGGASQAVFVPETLANVRGWLVWRFEPVVNPDGTPALDEQGNQRRTKVPYNARTGHHAQTNNPKTWVGLDEAKAALATGGYDGIGFAIPPESQIVGVDVDVPVEHQLAQAFIARFKSTYCERSPSGKLRIWCIGRPQRSGKGVHNKAIEVYASGSPRYLTHTGNHIPTSGKDLVDQQDVLDWVHAEFMDKGLKVEREVRPQGQVVRFEDHELIRKISLSKQGIRFVKLMDTPEGAEDDSGVDQTICNILAFWTRDEQQIERIWSTARIARRAKFQREDYRRSTIDNALAFVSEVYEPRDSHSVEVVRESQPAADAGAEVDPFGLMTAEAVVDNDPGELKPIVPDLIYPGLTLILARPKVGKSWLALDLLHSVATGQTIFGQMKCEQAPTIGLMLEDGHRRIRNRLIRMFGVDGARTKDMQVAYAWTTAGDGLNRLLDAHPEVRLVVIDTWAKFRASMPESRSSSAYQIDYEQMSAIQSIAIERDISIVANHHVRKSTADGTPEDPLELANGTSGLTAAIDAGIVISGNKQDGHKLYLRGRDVVEREWDIELNDRGLWMMRGEIEHRRRSDMSAEARRMREDGATWGAIAEELGVTRSVARRLCGGVSPKPGARGDGHSNDADDS